MIIISGAKWQKRNQIPKICNKLFPRFAIWRLFLLLARNLPCCREITIVSAGIDRWQWKYLWFSRRRKTSVWEFWGEVVVVFHFLNLAVALEQVLAENICREILILIWYTYDIGEDVSALILICLSCSGIRFFFPASSTGESPACRKVIFPLNAWSTKNVLHSLLAPSQRVLPW